ncbi:MAG: hypothetical protein WA210_07785 [Burkholderiaceae bacterium]
MKFRDICPASAFIAMALSACANSGAPGYASQQDRDIKALSPQEVQDLASGKGMGLAKAAELNGYPGPLHVLELAGELRLTARQRERTQALFDAMQANAIAAGAALVDAERELDVLFATRRATPQALAAHLEKVGHLQAMLRGVHLEAHLAQTTILEPAQVAHYVKLRGYSGAHDSGSHEHGPKP